MNKSSITLAAALAALSSGALAVDNVPPSNAPNQVQRSEQQREQVRKQEPQQKQMQQQTPAAEQKAKQIQMNKEHAIKKRVGPGPVA